MYMKKDLLKKGKKNEYFSFFTDRQKCRRRWQVYGTRNCDLCVAWGKASRNVQNKNVGSVGLLPLTNPIPLPHNNKKTRRKKPTFASATSVLFLLPSFPVLPLSHPARG